MMPAEKVRIARGWLEVTRLAERLRRQRQGRPMLELIEAGAGESRCAERPGGRTPRPAPLRLVREADGGQQD